MKIMQQLTYLALSSNLQGFLNSQITLLLMQNFHSRLVLDLGLIMSKVCVCHLDWISRHCSIVQTLYNSKVKHKYIHMWGAEIINKFKLCYSKIFFFFCQSINWILFNVSFIFNVNIYHLWWWHPITQPLHISKLLQ